MFNFSGTESSGQVLPHFIAILKREITLFFFRLKKKKKVIPLSNLPEALYDKDYFFSPKYEVLRAVGITTI